MRMNPTYDFRTHVALVTGARSDMGLALPVDDGFVVH
jgi:hypothetical protein